MGVCDGPLLTKKNRRQSQAEGRSYGSVLFLHRLQWNRSVTVDFSVLALVSGSFVPFEILCLLAW